MDLQALDAATDYRAVLHAVLGQQETKGEGTEVYIVPPMRPDEPLGHQRFSINLSNGKWKDHKTGEQGNMLSLAKTYGGPGWRDKWIAASPNAAAVFGVSGTSEQQGGGMTLDSFLESSTSTESKTRSTGSFGASLLKKSGSRSTPSTSSSSRSTKQQATFADQVAEGKKSSHHEAQASFEALYGVMLERCREAGAWFASHARGALASKAQWKIPHYDPASGKVVGIKSRGLVPIFKIAGELKKSKNEKGSKVGVFPWHDKQGSKDLIIVEGEKDGVILDAHVHEDFDVLWNLGGASTFKAGWVPAIEKKWAGRQVYVAYDDDAAGRKGAMKVLALLRNMKPKDVLLNAEGMDVADLIMSPEHGIEYVRARIAAASESEAEAEVTPQVMAALLDDEDLQKAGKEYDLAKAMYEMMVGGGAVFYHQDAEVAFCSWKRKVYVLRSTDARAQHMIAEATGFCPGGGRHKQVTQALAALAIKYGKETEASRWTFKKNGAVYFPLYDDEQQMVRITEDKIEVVPNGHDDVVFIPNTMVKPIAFLPDEVFNHSEAEGTLEWAWGHVNAKPTWQRMIHATFLSMFMYDFMQTRPHIRFQGEAGSGKSTAAQIMNIIMFSTPDLVGEMTSAALYRMGAAVPALIIDDLEDKDVKRNPDLGKAFLRAAVGGRRFKSSEDVSSVVEQALNCWFVTNGIFSIAEDNSALNERLLVVPILPKEKRKSSIYAKQMIDELMEQRDLCMNLVYREVQRMLKAVRDGAIQRLTSHFPTDQRSRLHEFYAMLSVALGKYDKPDAVVMQWLESAERGEKRAIVEGSSLAQLMYYLPSFLGGGTYVGHDEAAKFQLKPKMEGAMWTVALGANELHQVLTHIKRFTGLVYESRSVASLSSHLRSLKKAGAEEGISLEYDDHQSSVRGQRQRLWRIAIGREHVQELPLEPGVPDTADEDISF